MLSAGRTANIVLLNKSFHLLLTERIHALRKRQTAFRTVILYQLIRPETLMTFPAIHQRVGKAAQMPACHPRLGVHQNCTVHTHIVGVFHDKLLPPSLLYVIFQLHAKIAVIPCVSKSAVYLRTRVYKTSRLCQRNDFFHCFFHFTNQTFPFILFC